MNALSSKITEVLFTSLVFSITGLLVFLLAFWLIDKLTPGNLWQELVEKKNTAVAIFFGFIALGMSLIIAACLHG